MVRQKNKKIAFETARNIFFIKYHKETAGVADLIEINENGGFYGCIKAFQTVGGDVGGGVFDGLLGWGQGRQR